MNLLNNIWGDQQRYLQVLNNFLSNSVKFTPDNGSVRVVIKILDGQLVEDFTEIKSESKQKAPKIIKVGQVRDIKLQISIIDTGNGISEEGLKNLFLDFGRLEENSSQNRLGTGLGLSICKRIAD